MKTDLDQLAKRLDSMQTDIRFIKAHLTDVDSILTDDDVESLKDAEADLKAKKTRRL